MIIKSIEISNYRSCINTKFNLPKKLMTLIGPNGVGKSNILYSLQLFTKSEMARRFFTEESKSDLLNTTINLVMSIEDKKVYVRSKFYYDTDEKNVDDVYSTELKYRIEGNNPRKWNNIKPEYFDFIDYVKRRKIKELPKQFNNEKSRFTIQLLMSLSDISYYSATQFSDPSKCPISIELDDFGISYRRRNIRTHQQFMYDLYKSYKNRESGYELFLHTVGKSGLELIQDVQFNEHTIPSSSYRVRTGGEIQQIENSKRIIVPSIKIDGLILSPNQLSEGTFKTLALVFYILNDTSSFLLIEEPEVCVHHGLLTSIIQLIKQQSKYKQIIISTHSDYVLDMLNPENILLVNKDVNHGTQVSSLPNALSANDFQVLKQYLEEVGNLGEYWKEGGFEND